MGDRSVRIERDRSPYVKRTFLDLVSLPDGVPFWAIVLAVLTEVQLLVYDFPVKVFEGATNEGYIISVLKPALIALPLFLIIYRAFYIWRKNRKSGYISTGTKDAPSIKRFVRETNSVKITSFLYLAAWVFVHTLLGILVGIGIAGEGMTIDVKDITPQIAIFWLGELFLIVGLISELILSYLRGGIKSALYDVIRLLGIVLALALLFLFLRHSN